MGGEWGGEGSLSVFHASIPNSHPSIQPEPLTSRQFLKTNHILAESSQSRTK